MKAGRILLKTLSLLVVLGRAIAAALGADSSGPEPVDQPESLYQQAWYLQHGIRDVSAAIKAYQDIVTRFPDRPEVAARAQLNLVDCLESLGKVPEAKKELVKAYKLFPDELKKDPARMGRLKSILQHFDEGFNTDPEISDTQLAREMLDMIPLNEASKICETYYQNALQERADNPQGAILSLRKTVMIGVYLGLTERAADAQTMIGDIYGELGKYPEALAAYNRALTDFPDEVKLLSWTQVRVAETLRLTGRLDDSAAAYRDVLTKYPNECLQQAWALIWLGDLARHLGKPDEARVTWQKVVELSSDPQAKLAGEVAEFLLDEHAQPPQVSGKDVFANDVAYFLAVRFEALGKYYQQCMELSTQKDWPYELARRALAQN